VKGGLISPAVSRTNLALNTPQPLNNSSTSRENIAAACREISIASAVALKSFESHEVWPSDYQKSLPAIDGQFRTATVDFSAALYCWNQETRIWEESRNTLSWWRHVEAAAVHKQAHVKHVSDHIARSLRRNEWAASVLTI
jgi:hypothetical protein